MQVDKELITEKLSQLESYLNQIRELRSEPKVNFRPGHRTEDAAERRLERAIQCAIDIAGHIVTREALGNVTQYKDLFLYLGRAGILAPDLTDRLEKMAGFRNLLIHEYAVIDSQKVYYAVQKDIDDLTLFAKAIAEKYLPLSP